jgi:quercetin dioxygenase-like cupin family protein
MADRFEDDRGVIQDLVGEAEVTQVFTKNGPVSLAKVDGVTGIFTRAGSIRGNHVHYQTTQWTYVVSGRLLIATRARGQQRQEKVYTPGEMAQELPGVAHAWGALEDTLALVFTRGPRSGEDYESDTARLSGVDRLL